MYSKSLAVVIFSLSLFSVTCYADTAPFGVASAYNLVALSGNIGTNADVEGRIAAAGDVTVATTIGSTLGSDPWGSLADGYAMLANTGITTGNYFNINGGGNVYTPSNNAGYNFNENPHGTLVTTGPSPIDFSALSATLDAESLQLAAFVSTAAETGIVCQPVGTPSCAPDAPGAHNPSFLVLYGTDPTLNVFTLTAAEFANTNDPLDIVVPTGSTVVINVEGTNITLGTGIYYNGVQETDADGSNILFNMAGASTVAIDGQFDGALLAPFATLTGDSQMGGNFIAADIGQTGEVHNDEFTGTLPSFLSPTPEPGTLVLMGTGMLFIVLAARSRIRV